MANTNTSFAQLDFNNLKGSLITFLQGQEVFQDYNFEGSAINVLLDVLTYNTQYNAFYANMTANEAFLDTATLRSSVVSQAKLLDYVPRSMIAPTATVNVVASGLSSNTTSLTLPIYTNFISGPVAGVNYNFITTENYTTNVVGGTATFNNVVLKQGLPVVRNFSVNNAANPNSTFEIPDTNIDTTTIIVLVQTNTSSNAVTTFTLAEDYTQLNGSSTVYFLQEGISGNYQIYFGDGILGQQLQTGNLVTVQYITTKGTNSTGASSFTCMNNIGAPVVQVNTVIPANNGAQQENIESIRFQAPKQYATQGRAVTKDDYITFLQQNNLGYSFDAVSVWGGEENNPPVYGQVFCSLKPSGGYTLTSTQKQQIINKILAPVSVITVTPTIVDPDYIYLKISGTVVYDPKKTINTAGQIQAIVNNAVYNFANSNLNTFNAEFSLSDLTIAIQNADPSIVASDLDLKVQKRFIPMLTVPTSYTLNYNMPLERGVLTSGVQSSPTIQQYSTVNTINVVTGIYFEEVPTLTYGIDSIQILNPGYSYSSVPTITIQGDGTGATATATITNGQLSSITLTNSGNNYTQAVVTVTNAANDTSGQAGAAVASLQGRYGTIRTYYINSNNIKTVLNSNIGTIDYQLGIITLNNLSVLNVDNPLGILSINSTPLSTIISTSFNQLLTLDPTDATALNLTVIAK